MSHSANPARKTRIGAVSYLNTRPLIYRFADFAPDADLVLDVPSRLADRLATGDLDVALIPSIESFQNPDYQLVSDACIACRGPVLSVKLLSRVPIAEIQTLALDAGSRTSAALVQILLRERFGLSPELAELPIGPWDAQSSDQCDAVLLIGDRAIHASRFVYSEQWDLGEQWCDWTGLPFVFAMWTARPGIDAGSIAESLSRARDAGLVRFEEIAAQAADEVGLDAATCLSYFRDNLHFTMGPEERRGLQLFRRCATELGFAPAESLPRTTGVADS